MGIAKKMIVLVVGMIIGIAVLVALWPTLGTSVADIAALTETDIATDILQVVGPFLPLVVVVAAIGYWFKNKGS